YTARPRVESITYFFRRCDAGPPSIPSRARTSAASARLVARPKPKANLAGLRAVDRVDQPLAAGLGAERAALLAEGAVRGKALDDPGARVFSAARSATVTGLLSPLVSTVRLRAK